MSATNPFKIENGVLTEYEGPGGRVDIPAGVTSIGECAFQTCVNLTEVVIPEGVKDIGLQAFRGCRSLTRVVIPDGVASIGNSAFASCTGLTEVVIPASVASIGKYAFLCCTRLTEIKIPAGVMSIGKGAFCACSDLADITFPGSLVVIGNFVFSKCSSSQQIWVDGTAEHVENIRALLPEELRNKVHSALRRAWFKALCAVAIGVAEPSSVAGKEENPSKKVKQASEAKPSPTSTPLLATLLSDGMRMCIPPTAVAVDEATSHQVLSEYAGMVGLFL